MAISSPLLEDIDLAGARGVLVNITAGFDMKLDEFETVGNTVKAFASDNATVVIGTSLDPEMSDELRVTVVATGIGGERKPDISIVSREKEINRSVESQQSRPQLNETAQRHMQSTNQNKNEINKNKSEHDYLDIPAFLRKQAD